ncbi:DUF1642 domain-containing protein [Lactococcus garvieae]|uniref:DUF1642 domain-containing protein n=1 Tax=Lactococcus garvieae TaxID=1363 RepID=UPI0038537F93
MKKFEEELKRPVIGIEQSSIKPSLGKAIEFYTDKVKEYHNAFNEMNKYIDTLEAQLDYYKKDKRFEVMAEEILSLKSQLEKQQPEVLQFVADWYETNKNHLELALFHEIKLVLEDEYPHENEFHAWIDEYENKPLETIFAMKCLGYTVKEKLFYLKDNRELESVGNTCIGYVTLYLKNDGYLTTDKTRAGKFTQQEIDSMETGSYEQIEVEG